MTAALQLSSAERLDSSAPAPGRSPPIASPSGPSFAELLQRGQATHNVPAQTAKPPPSQTDEPPSEDIKGERGDAAPQELAPEAPAAGDKVPAKPAPRAREKTPPSTRAAQTSPPPASADGNTNEAAPARPAADDSGGCWPPGTVPIDLHEWMASLRPPEPLPAQSGLAAPRNPVPTADGVTVLGPANATNPLGPADGAVLPGATVDASALVSTAGATVLTAADKAAVLRPADRAAAARPAEGAAVLGPIDRAALLRPADGAVVAPPVPATTNGLQPQRSTADRADPRRSGSDSVAATQGALPAAPGPDPAALASGERRPAPPDLPAARDLVQGLLSGAAGAVRRGFDAATLAPIALPAPLHSPEFAQLLGAQVSVLARNGVQQAELHLNPAEMGPISVRIRIDDKDARVDFHAGAAATREVIERGLPELASALREQGLTLAGGGVFQQPPDPRGQPEHEAAGASDKLRRTASMIGDGPARTIAIPVPQGTLDVYA
jgi:flagellar hook-length control protein FliK